MLINYISDKNRAGGWSESWYGDFTLDAARVAFDAVEKERAKMLPNGIIIVGQRFTVLSDPQSIHGKSVSTNNEYPGAFGFIKDVPQMALLCRVRGDGVPNVKRYTLRGVPDQLVVGGEYIGSSAFDPAFNGFANQLRTQAFRFRALDNSQAIVGLQGILSDGTYSLAASLALNVGDYITILRCRDQNGHAVTGTFQVATVTSGVGGKLANWKGQVVIGSGAVRKRVFIYPTLNAATNTILRSIVKKVGRSFFQYRGRRSTRR